MDMFRRLPDYFISQAKNLRADFMHGLETNVVLSALRDEMNNTAPGYSFVSRASNGLANGYARLLLYACAQHGSLSPLAGHGRWSWIAVRQYLCCNKIYERVDCIVIGYSLSVAGALPFNVLLPQRVYRSHWGTSCESLT
jgi:hypothetical protein